MSLSRSMFREITPEMVEHVKTLISVSGNCNSLYRTLNINYVCYNAKTASPVCPFTGSNIIGGYSMCGRYVNKEGLSITQLCEDFLYMLNGVKRKLKDLDWEDSSASGG